ncbi:myosin light chain kinase, smooth muscle [Eurytemora carolleeae]|uniref:myosin light chain kinase, smooth muscle n=1 Tax=Eurytemora carolleeae TaxID=1294199 RepID=UPI000C767BCA|nr:myosin light chain kinase, smooth muscle [Eurytemora carolleeae]|eukprot:XP_023339998.1 myosin light chain kinase, smooth muscle-like [Eurytemora affinis]
MMMYGYYEKHDHTLLVTEYLRGGELFKQITERGFNLTEKKVNIYVLQIVQALNYIHDKRVVHLDIKPQNIMLQSRNQDVIKLIDFGLARELSSSGRVQANICGTMGFIAPEVLNCRYASPATDFFSLGVVIYMLLSGGHEPFWFKDDMTTSKRTLHLPPNYSCIKRVSQQAIHFIDGLLQKKQETRLHGKDCLSHPWLSGKELVQDTVLETAKMRSYMARNRWKKAFKCIRATIRMKALGEKIGPYRWSQEIPCDV